MKKTIILILVLLSHVSFAQINLVPNPSFEDTLDCGLVLPPAQAPPWFDPTLGTPDYYSIYSSCGGSSVNNPAGYQLPRTGNAYVGIYTWSYTTREYIEVPLIDSLHANRDYLIQFYVSRAEKFYYASDRIGAYLSIDTITQNDPYNFPFIPQIENPSGNILYDSMNWVPISGIYNASGGERYLTIGNFSDTTNTLIDSVGGGVYPDAYYYIDDVSVIDYDSLMSITQINNNTLFEVFPNPALRSQNIYIRNKSLNEGGKNAINVLLKNTKGITYFNQKIFRNNNVFSLISSNLNLSSGVYYLNIITDYYIITKKIIILN